MPHYRYLIIGGGFIGSEIAAALATHGCKVTMLFPEDGIGSRLFPADLARFLVGYYRAKGIEIRMGDGLAGLQPSGGGVAVQTTAGQAFEADVVVAGLGIQPNVDLTQQAGLAIENGVVVDEFLRANDPDVFAAATWRASTTRP